MHCFFSHDALKEKCTPKFSSRNLKEQSKEGVFAGELERCARASEDSFSGDQSFAVTRGEIPRRLDDVHSA